MASPTDRPLVIVEWDDHKGDDGTPLSLEDVESFHKPKVITTIGWLLKEDESGVTIANEYFDQTYRGTTFVDKRMLRSLTPYKLSKPRKPKS
jgi:hypothetical protein